MVYYTLVQIDAWHTPGRRRAVSLALLALFAALFLIANRGAYEGYYSDDDLDNLSWTRGALLGDFAMGLVSLRYSPLNFRPAGHFYFYLLGRTAGLDFRWYAAAVHMLHLAGVVLLWLLLRDLAFTPIAAAAGALFFGFHMGLFDALWKPMYVFDVLCAIFSMLCLLAWRRGHLVISFLCFWLAYKSKEQAVMLPLVLAAYELWLGERRWKPLALFFAVALSFGVQGLLFNPNIDNDYTFKLRASSLALTIPFYSSRVLLAPYLGLALLALPFVVRDRRLWFGVAMAGLLLAPVLFLPGRLFAAYLYAPIAALGIAAAALADRFRWGWTAAFFALWLPSNYAQLRWQRHTALAEAQENRAWTEAAGEAVRQSPETRTFIYDGAPRAMHRWGIAGALRWFTGAEVKVYDIADAGVSEAFSAPGVMLLGWDPLARKLHAAARTPGGHEASYIEMTRGAPIWQLEEGWYPLEQRFRWIRPKARARLWRPAGARRFDLVVNAGPQLLKDLGFSRVEVLLNGASLGTREFREPGWQRTSWEVSPADPGPVAVEFRVTPEYRPVGRDPRVLGIAIVSFGFAT